MATWFVIVGFFLVVVGLVLRTVMMMRSSDVTPPVGRVLHGRELLQNIAGNSPKTRCC